MAEHTPFQAYLYSITCLYCYFSSRIIRHLNLAVTTPQNHAQHHGLHTMCKCKRKVGRQEENWAHIKSSHHQRCEHTWRQTGWNLPSKITQHITCPRLSAPIYLCLLYSWAIWSSLTPAGHCRRTYMLLQFLWPFSLHYCPPQLPKCGNAFVPLASSLLVGKPLRPWETPAHPTHACSEYSLYAVVWGHLPGHCWGQLQYKKKAMQKPKSKTKRTSISSLETATVSSEQLTTSALFIRKYMKLSNPKWCMAHAWPVVWSSFILALAAWSWEDVIAWSSHHCQPSLAAAFSLMGLSRGRNLRPRSKVRWGKLISLGTWSI